MNKKFLHCHKNNKKRAFTLAEVAVVLMILGIIAIVTIPVLISNYQKRQTLSCLKKTYAAITQAANRSVADNGPIDTWDLGASLSAEDAKNFLKKYITPYMNISKEPTTHTEGNWNNQYKTLSNNDLEYSENSVRFYLQDGTSINGYINNNDAGKKRFIIMVDINGDKSPNQFGRDIFQMSYYIHFNKLPELNGKLVPTGIENTREELLAPNDYMCNKASSGSRCAALIMKDGWQILDDYPW